MNSASSCEVTVNIGQQKSIEIPVVYIPNSVGFVYTQCKASRILYFSGGMKKSAVNC